MLGAECLVPQRGDKKKLLDMSLRNAQFAMRDRHAQLEQVDPDAAKDRLMETLMHDLRLKERPVHMECFDNSNIQARTPPQPASSSETANPRSGITGSSTSVRSKARTILPA